MSAVPEWATDTPTPELVLAACRPIYRAPMRADLCWADKTQPAYADEWDQATSRACENPQVAKPDLGLCRRHLRDLFGIEVAP